MPNKFERSTAGPTILRGSVVTPDTVIDDGIVVFEGALITHVGPTADAPADLQPLLPAQVANPNTILPGLVDVHCHGGGGVSFPDVTDPTQARVAAREHLRHGTTSLVASLVTQTPETILERVRTLTELAIAGDLAGIHLEGPFLAKARCGAQDPALLQEPDPELVRAVAREAQGYFVTMTIAPELPGIFGEGGVAEVLAEVGALPSYGHTDAAQGEMRAGLAASFDRLADPTARSKRPTVTHLFNGMRPVQHREAGPIPDSLAAAGQGKAVVELVADGTHLNSALVLDIFELVGRENIALVTDAMAAAGMPDGDYRLGSMAVVVRGGVARLDNGTEAGGAIAGGTAHLLDVVRVTVQAGVPLVDAVFSASVVPSEVLGREDLRGLTVGSRADIFMADAELTPLAVWRAGDLVS